MAVLRSGEKLRIQNAKLILFALVYYFVLSTSGNSNPEPSTPTDNVLERSNNSRREEVLDENNKYVLIWDSDFAKSVITFQVIVKTLGYVGFGISPNGGMTGADMVIGGVHPNGTSYFSDYFGTGNQKPKLDPKQDWELLEATENGTHTMLKFQRLFSTCDKNDYKIGNDTSSLIWSFGETDTINYHATNRGSFAVNLLDPPMPTFNTSSVSTWRISSDFEMPANDTTYWCTMHSGPSLTSKHHAIGFEAYLPTAAAKTHTHHFIVHECRGDNKTDLTELIKPLANSEGDHCYQHGNASKLLQYCQSYLVVWASGGRRTIFPEKVGYPLGDSPNLYYMLEIHYNNPEQLRGVKFETGLNVFYTSKLREFDSATLAVGHDVLFTQVIPPRTKSFMTVGHCSSECTSEAIPPEGINIFNVILHSHLAGRKIKLRQFRDGEEIAWMANDDNYNFDYQQNRPMREEIKLLPGDQLALECVYDTTSRENVTIGGLATQDEMCQAFLLYYPRVDMWFCGSFNPYNETETLKRLGVEKVEWIPGSWDFLVTAPKQLAGKRYSTLLNEIDWTEDKVQALQTKARFGNHTLSCGYHGHRERSEVEITYPYFAKEYIVEDSCHVKSAV